MKVLITGLNGSLAPQLAQAATHHGHEVVDWNRSEVDPDDAARRMAWLAEVNPGAVFHLALGSVEWAACLSRFAADRNIPMVFTSSAMVFHHEPPGPHRVESERTAQDDYGRYKIACEDAILREHPNASVARIGWQIDPVQPGNNMLMALDQWQVRDGCVAASRAWIPACSFMQDTAHALLSLCHNRASGVVHLDSNADEGLSFVQIVRALRQRFGRERWIVREHDDYRHDQRLIGGDRFMPPLSTRLAGETAPLPSSFQPLSVAISWPAG